MTKNNFCRILFLAKYGFLITFCQYHGFHLTFVLLIFLLFKNTYYYTSNLRSKLLLSCGIVQISFNFSVID